jgi:anti-sigma regulatory factor (Ser/Thr protein kinase)/DNA-binding response OmpR family regulator
MRRKVRSVPNAQILILAPTGRDASLAADVLAEAKLKPTVCADVDSMCRELQPEAAAAIIAEEALTAHGLNKLCVAINSQPAWSDIPIIILTAIGPQRDRLRQQDAINRLGSTTLLERPLRVATLVHAAKAAVSARARQYEVRDHLQEHIRLEEQIKLEHVKQRAFLRDVLASVTGGRLRLCDTSDDLPRPMPVLFESLALGPKGALGEIRNAARQAAIDLGFGDDRWQDLLTAVGEASMNAVVHGGGGTGRVCASENGTVQVWIEDRGKGIDVKDLPKATLSKGFTTAGSLGHGMKMMLECVDRVWLLTGIAGTTVVIEQDRRLPAPEWY